MIKISLISYFKDQITKYNSKRSKYGASEKIGKSLDKGSINGLLKGIDEFRGAVKEDKRRVNRKVCKALERSSEILNG